MAYLIRYDAPQTVDDEFDYLENVVAEIVADFIGHDTVIGYVYVNKDGKLRRQLCGWL
jgi:hypothetical protein